jgi:hypothetical protein
LERTGKWYLVVIVADAVAVIVAVAQHNRNYRLSLDPFV